MSIKNRNTLKSEFVSGTAATSSKFDDIFDSHFNKYEDSVLAGPLGLTGTNGLVGPDGATFFNGLIGPGGTTFHNGLLGPDGETSYNGVWYTIINDVPGSTGATGIAGQISADINGIWVCYEDNKWVFLSINGNLPGPTGAQGSTGAQGVTGPSGGPIGPQGVTGPSGGPIGPTGEIGATGSQGIQGSTGPKGATGNDGIFQLVTAPTGPGSLGSTGQIAFVGTNMYMCTSTNNWVKFIGTNGF
jgi:hypothetical protein